MSRPAKRNRKDQIRVYSKRQTWALLIVIVAAWIIDISWFDGQLVVAKSAAIGGLLSFITQIVFALFMFSHTGYGARNRIVSQFFRGQALNWLLTLFGFALIFIIIKPLSAPALFIGFIVMKMSHMVMLSHIR